MKKRMKALAAIALSVCMLTGCGSSQKPAAPAESSAGGGESQAPAAAETGGEEGRRYGLFRGDACIRPGFING